MAMCLKLSSEITEHTLFSCTKREHSILKEHSLQTFQGSQHDTSSASVKLCERLFTPTVKCWAPLCRCTVQPKRLFLRYSTLPLKGCVQGSFQRMEMLLLSADACGFTFGVCIIVSLPLRTLCTSTIYKEICHVHHIKSFLGILSEAPTI